MNRQILSISFHTIHLEEVVTKGLTFDIRNSGSMLAITRLMNMLKLVASLQIAQGLE